MSDKEDLDFDFKDFKGSTNGNESSDSFEEASPQQLGYVSIPNFSDEEEEDEVTVSTVTEEVNVDFQITEDLPNNISHTQKENDQEEENKRLASMREFEERYKRDIKEQIENVETLKRGKDFELNSDSVSTIKDMMKGFTLAKLPEWAEPTSNSNSNGNTVEWLAKVAEDLKSRKSQK